MHRLRRGLLKEAVRLIAPKVDPRWTAGLLLGNESVGAVLGRCFLMGGMLTPSPRAELAGALWGTLAKASRSLRKAGGGAHLQGVASHGPWPGRWRLGYGVGST